MVHSVVDISMAVHELGKPSLLQLTPLWRCSMTTLQFVQNSLIFSSLPLVISCIIYAAQFYSF